MKDTIKTLKRQATEWEKIHGNYIADKGFASRKEPWNLNNKETNIYCYPVLVII